MVSVYSLRVQKSEVSLSDTGGSPERESVTSSPAHSVSLAHQSIVKGHLYNGHLRDRSCVLTPGIGIVTVRTASREWSRTFSVPVARTCCIGWTSI